jgi:hypothetical protein
MLQEEKENELASDASQGPRRGPGLYAGTQADQKLSEQSVNTGLCVA